MGRRPGNSRLRGIPIDENGAIAFEPLPSIAMEPMINAKIAACDALEEIRRILQISPFVVAEDVPAALEKRLTALERQINDQRIEIERLRGKRVE